MSESGDGSSAPLPRTELALQDWDDKYWKAGNTKFHRQEVNILLEKHVEKLLNGRQGLKILIPLCGKTLDMKWLADKGHTVIGVEFVEQAILEFFSEQDLEFTKETVGSMGGDVYKCTATNIRIYRGDFFQFDTSLEGSFDAVWDRGALVAINHDDRERYAKAVKSLCSDSCRMFISTVDYDTSKWPGPPHVLSTTAVEELYGNAFTLEEVDRRSDMTERWEERGMESFYEVLYLLQHK